MVAIPQSFSTPGAGDIVRLGGLILNGGESDGVEWTCSALDGWDSPTVREDLDPRALAHGVYRGPSYYGVRELTVRGLIHARHGLDSLRVALDRFAYETDLTDVDALLIRAEEPPKQVAVRRSGKPRWVCETERLARFELDLTAADPRKYGTVLRSVTLTGGQSATASNAGQFRAGAPLVLVFTGAGTLQVGAVAVTVSGPATIDTLEGTVMDGGSTVYSRLTSSGQLPTLPPAAGTSVSYTGGGQVTLTWRDTWV